MTIEDLKNLKPELKRFEAKLDAALKRLAEYDGYIYGCKETGAVKRAALDLKNELTKITK